MIRTTITTEQGAELKALWKDWEAQSGLAMIAIGKGDMEAASRYDKLAGVAIKRIREIYGD